MILWVCFYDFLEGFRGRREITRNGHAFSMTLQQIVEPSISNKPKARFGKVKQIIYETIQILLYSSLQVSSTQSLSLTFPFTSIVPCWLPTVTTLPSPEWALPGLFNIIQYLIIQIFDQLPEMADKDTKKEGVEDTELKRTRITFSGNKLNAVQQVTNQLVGNAKTQGVKISGPVRLPNKHLRICCRRSPCGEGSKTWDNWEMTIYKRYIDLECTTGQMKEVTSITIPNGIEISVDFRTTA